MDDDSCCGRFRVEGLKHHTDPHCYQAKWTSLGAAGAAEKGRSARSALLQGVGRN